MLKPIEASATCGFTPVNSVTSTRMAFLLRWSTRRTRYDVEVKIFSYEIESVVNQHASVLESAAIAVPSEIGEDDVKIVAVPETGRRLRPEELIRFCGTSDGYFMVPRYVEFRDALRKTLPED